MAGYVSKNLSVLSQSIGGRGPGVWLYWTSDSIATVAGAGYVSDATNKQMLVGDVVMVFSGTLNTTGPDQVPSTHAAGTVSEFASDPSFAWFAVDSVTSGAATLKEVTVQLGGNIGFYGAAPVSQRANSIQATSVISSYTATTASALVGALLVEIANTLNGLGLWKGSA